MGILIKGMEMPKSCDDCIFHDMEGGRDLCSLTRDFISDGSICLGSCPLVPIPEHGRLCDFDKFYEYIDYYLCKNCEKACSDCDVPWIKKVISQAPAVLEENNMANEKCQKCANYEVFGACRVEQTTSGDLACNFIPKNGSATIEVKNIEVSK